MYCGAFVGMTTEQNVGFIVLASFIAMLAFVVLKSYVVQVGGRLGTFAFIGVLSSLLLWKLL